MRVCAYVYLCALREVIRVTIIFILHTMNWGVKNWENERAIHVRFDPDITSKRTLSDIMANVQVKNAQLPVGLKGNS